jgi:hypothetical protein
MALVDLWNSDRDQIAGKRIDQLISFAGEGRLRDGNTTSAELRSLLAAIPSEYLGRWIGECLENRFTDFGFVLQDIVNEIGKRLRWRNPSRIKELHRVQYQSRTHCRLSKAGRSNARGVG